MTLGVSRFVVLAKNGAEVQAWRRENRLPPRSVVHATDLSVRGQEWSRPETVVIELAGFRELPVSKQEVIRQSLALAFYCSD